MEFPKEDYKKMLYSRHEAAKLGLKPMEPWKTANAARLMAIVHTFGNNEGFTLSPKFNADREYIQDIYNIDAGRTPDNERFNDYLRHYIEKFEAVTGKDDPYFKEADEWIQEMYNFKLFC